MPVVPSDVTSTVSPMAPRDTPLDGRKPLPLGTQAPELAAQRVRLARQLGDRPLALGLGLLQNRSPLALHTGELCPELVVGPLSSGAELRALGPIRARLGEVLVDLLQQLVDAPLGGMRLPTGVPDDRGGHPEALGDGEGVAPSGQADHEPIRWAQALGVELDGSVLHARRRVGEGLQLGVVRGGNRVDARVHQMLQDGAGEGGPLLRVSARTDLVEQHERGPVGRTQDVHDAGDV
jgi:hypothetical protein